MSKEFIIGLAMVFSCITCCFAQDNAATTESKAAEYAKVVTKRAEKIVDNLSITDSVKYKKAVRIIAGQYIALNNVYTDRDEKLKAVKQLTDQDAAKKQTEDVTAVVTDKVNKLHVQYLSDLGAVLSPQQVDNVKDGMTYNVKNVTYKAYNEMLPGLTEAQKSQILTWLIEAREHSMDAESSNAKHAWFGKYKGRINNYLSAAGIDMKKAGEEWQKRIKEEQAKKNNKVEGK
jgi:hypothetical protein